MKDLECQAKRLSLPCIQEPGRVSRFSKPESNKIRRDYAKEGKEGRCLLHEPTAPWPLEQHQCARQLL